MTTATTIWSEEIDNLHSFGRDLLPQIASWFPGLSLRQDNEHLVSGGILAGSYIDSPITVSPESFDAQTDVGPPQSERKLGALRCGGYFLAQPPNIADRSTEGLDWHRVGTLEEYFADYLRRLTGAREIRRAYQSRIGELIRYGIVEGILLNEASVMDFWGFVRSAGYTRQARLAFMDNGDIRAVWKGDEGDHLGLHFLGNQAVNYVMFKRRPGAIQVSRVAGNDTFEGIKRQIRAFSLTSLVNR